MKPVGSLAVIGSLFILLALPKDALADSSVKGIVARVTSTGIQLSTGRSYSRLNKGVGVAEPELTINGPTEVNTDYVNGPQHIISDPTWFSLHEGDYVQLNLNVHGKIVLVHRRGHLNDGRIEQSPLEYRVVAGGWYWENDVIINGRIFPQAGVMDVVGAISGMVVGNVVLPNRENWDRFEAWVGKRGDTGEGSIHFVVLADGKELYKSLPMNSDDAPVKISVPIRGYSGVTLRAYGDEKNGYLKSAVWGNPLFIKQWPPNGRSIPSPPTVDDRRIEHSLVGDAPASGEWRADDQPVTIGGHAFQKTVTMTIRNQDSTQGPDDYEKVVFSNADNCDLFECSVGFKDNGGKGWLRFKVEGDGKTLFLSNKMSDGDPPTKISVHIKDYSGVTLEGILSEDSKRSDVAVWANPVFIHLPSNGAAHL